MENVALCGLVNILGEDNIKVNKQSVEVPLKCFENFEENYFNYFSSKYKKQSSLTKIIAYETTLEHFENSGFEDFTEDNFNDLKKYLTTVLKKGESNSYKAVYDLFPKADEVMLLINDALKLEKLKKNEFISQHEVVIDRVKKCYEKLSKIFAYYKQPEINKYLSAKIQIYSVINKGYNDVSFLNRQESKGDFYEKYHNYFVKPIFEYLEEDHSKNTMACTNCNRPIKNGNISYGFITQAGFDSNRKLSNSWDFINDLAMCPICRLLYTCIPAGFTYVFDNGIFVNDNHSVQRLVKVNNGISGNVLTFNEKHTQTNNTYAALIQSLQEAFHVQQKQELNDIQVVRYEQGVYNFNLLSKVTLNAIANSESRISELFNAYYLVNKEYHYVYQEVIDCLMNNRNLYSLINQILYYKSTGSVNRISAWQLIDMIEINNNILKEMGSVRKFTKDELEKIRISGYWFKKGYSNDSKPKTISYHLQNALRANDKYRFMDVLLNAYSYLNTSVPKFFSDIFIDDDQFKTIGYSFVTGIVGENSKHNNESVEGGNENE
jgi:CRISPR-associated protein Cst1